MLPQCDIKLKPPRIPSSGKKLYREFFIREMKQFTHVYWMDGLYLVSVPQPLSARGWIDDNHDEIFKRKWVDEVRTLQPTLF